MAKPTRHDRFQTLLDEHEKIVYKVANAYCWNPTDREDLAQEIVLQLWRSFDRFDASKRFSTWMYRVALNVAISFVRHETRRARLAQPAEESMLELAAEPSESAALERDLQLERNLRRLQRFIARLGELDRALVLLYLDGHRHDEIADALGISKSNVGTRIGRIKQRLERDWADLERKES